jgi:FkbM family methyltransferase
MTTSNPVDLAVPQLREPLTLFVHGSEDKFVSQTIRTTGIWEPYETSLLFELLQPGSVFVDVGANIGYFTVLAASIVGEGGKVFAFEPDPDNIRLLRTSVELNKFQSQVESVEAGLSNTAMAGQLYLSEDNLGDHQIFPGEDGRDSLPITLCNGSDYLRPCLTKLDLLKVDTQGSEFQVIGGLMPLLQQLPCIPHIIIELTPYSLRQAGASGRQLIELLATLEQSFWIIDHIEHRLVESSAADLALWCDNVDACAGDEGFMNILIGPGCA